MAEAEDGRAGERDSVAAKARISTSSTTEAKDEAIGQENEARRDGRYRGGEGEEGYHQGWVAEGDDSGEVVQSVDGEGEWALEQCVHPM
jgi:hypothetical protein